MSYKVYDTPSWEIILTLFYGVLFWWISNEILSRLFGFKGNIYQTKILKEYDENMMSDVEVTYGDQDMNGKSNDDDIGSGNDDIIAPNDNVEVIYGDNDINDINRNSITDNGSIRIEIERLKTASNSPSTLGPMTPTLESRTHGTPLPCNDATIKPTAKLHQRMSKRLDVKNEFRIKINPIPYYLKFLFNSIIFVISLVDFIIDPDWHYDMYIGMNPKSNNYVNLQHCAAIIVSFYVWEIIFISQYGRLAISVCIHHWLAASAAIFIIIGIYNPFAVLYAEINIGFAFMVSLSMATRAHIGQKYPRFVRNICTFSKYYYAIVTTCNCIGQILLMINGQKTETISILYTIIIGIGIIGCLFDDVELIKTLNQYSNQTYEYLLW